MLSKYKKTNLFRKALGFFSKYISVYSILYFTVNLSHRTSIWPHTIRYTTIVYKCITHRNKQRTDYIHRPFSESWHRSALSGTGSACPHLYVLTVSASHTEETPREARSDWWEFAYLTLHSTVAVETKENGKKWPVCSLGRAKNGIWDRITIPIV